MTRIEQSGQTGGNAVAEKRIDLTYDAAGRWEEITRYADLAGTQLVAASDFTFDGLGRMTQLTHSQDTTTLADYQWSYDAASRVTQFISLADGTADYSYDATNQLTAADYDYQDDESFAFDANGNRIMTGYTIGTNNQLLSDGTFDYVYDAEGNRIARTHIATGEVTYYEWDHRNRLVRIATKDSEQELLKEVTYLVRRL